MKCRLADFAFRPELPGRAAMRRLRPWAARGSRWLWPGAGVLLVLGLGLSLLFPAGRHQWALSLIRQPARYTALSFSQPSALPAAVVRGHPMLISFTVANHEGRRVKYTYVVTATAGRRTQILQQAVRAVAAGATWKASVTVRPRCQASPCRITVSLPGHPAVIDFLAVVQASTGHR
jgi:hypothetical protein